MSPLSAVLDTAQLRKARGAFFTPPPVAQFIVDWAIRDVSDSILEPSCGEASFLLAAVDRLDDLRTRSGRHVAPRLDGFEIHQASRTAAEHLLQQAGVTADIREGDFFDVEPSGRYDVVVGNPPFVRYQEFAGDQRSNARKAALRAGVGLTNLASSWASFAVHASLFLRAGGRMGLVLPAELLSVNYAAPVRRFLLSSFASIELVMFDQRVFPDVQEEVVLLLADGYKAGSSNHMSIYEAQNAEELASIGAARVWSPIDPSAKWTPSLISVDTTRIVSASLSNGHFSRLKEWGETTLGMVTGNNKYFTLSSRRVEELGLTRADIVPLSPPGSRHLRQLSLTAADIDKLVEADAATWLFRPAGDPSDAALSYIEAGEVAGVNTAFKCRVREPWWRVPLVRPADLFLTYMNADTARLCTNETRRGHLNSVHGVYLRESVGDMGRNLLPLASLNSLTLVGAEMVGRSYGGGMLKLEPREADTLPVPSPDLVRSCSDRLGDVRGEVLECLRAGQLLHAVTLVDEVVLVGGHGMDEAEVSELRKSYVALHARRTARAGKARKS